MDQDSQHPLAEVSKSTLSHPLAEVSIKSDWLWNNLSIWNWSKLTVCDIRPLQWTEVSSKAACAFLYLCVRQKLAQRGCLVNQVNHWKQKRRKPVSVPCILESHLPFPMSLPCGSPLAVSFPFSDFKHLHSPFVLNSHWSVFIGKENLTEMCSVTSRNHPAHIPAFGKRQSIRPNSSTLWPLGCWTNE